MVFKIKMCYRKKGGREERKKKGRKKQSLEDTKEKTILTLGSIG